jgi:hypothetical protein
MPSISRFLARVFNPPATAGQLPPGFSDWTIAGVRFAQDGLSAGTASETSMTWTAPGCEVELTQSALDRPLDPADVERFRNEQRRIAIEKGRGIISADVLFARGIPLTEVITKARDGTGYDYVGTITAADASHTYTIRVTTHPGTLTGVREALVSAALIPMGELRLPKQTGRIIAFLGDPYDAAWDEDALNAITDDERLDVLFPDHPLSRLRALLDQIGNSITLAAPPPASQENGELAIAAPPRRRLLSDAAAREMQWAFKRFEPIETSLRETLTALDSRTEESSEAIAEHLLLLGIVQSQQQKSTQAIESFARALERFRTVLGPNEPKTALAMGYLACAHLELEQFDAAAELFPQALKVLETAMPNHPAVGTILFGYGQLLSRRDPGRDKDASDRALEIIRQHPAPTIVLREFAGAPVLDRAPHRA